MTNNKDDSFPENTPETAPTKSAVKRAMNELQKLGESLVDLSDSQLEQMTLSEDLFKAIKHAQTLKSHEAKRRQMQLIGKLMRRVDSESIRDAMKQIQYGHKKETDAFHQIEKWREDLITQGDEALQRFCELNPAIDRQALRQLIRKAQHDRKNNKNTGGEHALFKYLKEFSVS